jgi:hypothetical protein
MKRLSVAMLAGDELFRPVAVNDSVVDFTITTLTEVLEEVGLTTRSTLTPPQPAAVANLGSPRAAR